MSIGRSATAVLALVSITLAVPAPAGAATPSSTESTGSAWRLADVPVEGRANLTGVTAISRDDAWAVGFTVPEKSAATITEKAAVTEKSAATTTEKSVGAEECDATGLPALALHWDGASWKQVPVPNLGRLNAVSASGHRNVWAAADCGVLRWDGQAWTRTTPVPIPGTDGFYFTGIKAVSAYDVWLSGFAWDGVTGNDRGFVQHWDGVRWRLVDLPPLGDNFDISGIDAGGRQDVWVAGTGYTDRDVTGERLLILHWNGYGWKRFPAPATTMVVQRVARVRAVAPDDVWIAGLGQRDPGGWDIDRPLILHWDGVTWTDTHAPEERGNLHDIAADGHAVLAAGDTYSPLDDTYEAYVRRWTATGWAPAAVPVSGLASINALAASPDGGMWAVGSAGDETSMRPFIARTGC
ncbi:MAG: hypothetical protein HOV83_36560 [Catenulispora sp.]|nr:hypothetical protein [Catenulispora sp.]